MNRKFWIVIVAVFFILAFFFWLSSKKEATVIQPTSNHILTTQSLKTNVSNIGLATPTSEEAAVISNKNVAKIEQQWKQEAAERNSSIEFYGQILDQNGNPVEGAKINSTIRHWYLIQAGVLGEKPINIERISDAAGRFEISGETGDGFGVLVSKNGYLSPPNARYGFGPKAGTFEKPVIFKMWKEGEKAQLVGGSHVFGIDSGKNYTLNLLTGKKIEGDVEGDLRVSITRPADVKQTDRFSWSFSIQAIGGGLVEADPDDEFMYVAPESGYEPKLEMQLDPSDPNWKWFIKKQFFIKSRDGQVYGRASVEIDSIYNVHSAIQIDYAVNPNGSRNLQP